MKRLIPSLPEDAHLGDVVKRFPQAFGPLLEYHDRVLRDEGELTVAQRELIAAYVSGLNACAFCFGAHTLYARAFGIDPETVEALLADPENAPVDERLKPLLAYVAKLTREPSRLTEADAKAAYAVGWSEQALFEAVQVCGLFNLMNRIVEGSGVTNFPMDPKDVPDDEIERRRTRLYSDWGREIGLRK